MVGVEAAKTAVYCTYMLDLAAETLYYLELYGNLYINYSGYLLCLLLFKDNITYLNYKYIT